jgi:hypothetical protein
MIRDTLSLPELITSNGVIVAKAAACIVLTVAKKATALRKTEIYGDNGFRHQTHPVSGGLFPSCKIMGFYL